MGALKDGDGVRLHAPAKQVWRERAGGVLLRGSEVTALRREPC